MKRFRDDGCARDQLMLLPSSLDDMVSAEHEVRLFDEIIASLDLSCFDAAYTGGGAPAYDPQVMVRAVLYGFWRAVRSSRELARQLEENLAFRWLCQGQRPSYVTVTRFLSRHRDLLVPLFVQTVALARRLGMVSLTQVSVDGSAIEANVSGKNTYSQERLQQALLQVNSQIELWLERDREEEQTCGARQGNGNGNEMPAELAALNDRKARLEALERARDAMERRSIAATDPESRMMRVRQGSAGAPAMRPAYNAQAAVDAERQVIVAAEITNQQTDNAQLPAMVEQAVRNTGQSPQLVLADAGYSGPATVACTEKHPEIDFYVAEQGRKSDKRERFTYDATRDIMLDKNGREHFFSKEAERHGTRYRIYRAKGRPTSEIWEPQHGDFHKKMRQKLSTAEGKAIYDLRRQTVEPVFGFLKTRLGLRRFHRRGLKGVRIEYLLACIAHNLGKIVRYGQPCKASV